MNDYKKLLNDKQYEAVVSTNKYLRIIAGAGSGKTRVLTYRIAYLIEQLGYYPSSILAITFTNKAAEEIRNRVEKFVNNGNHLNMNISTFHSFCARILREDCKAINYPSNFNIIDEDDQKKIIKDIMKEKEVDEKLFKVSGIIDYIANRKNHFISSKEAIKIESGNKINETKAIVYDEYEDILHKNFSLDFDDLIIKTIQMFEEHDALLEKWQNRIRHILVDEFQDVDPNQYQLVKLLAGKENEVTVVGDPDQTIYTWRGADIQIILNFDTDFEGTQTISLEENYRSTGEILAIANRLIDHNRRRIKKNLYTNLEQGVKIAQYKGENEDDEARYVVKNIIDLHDALNVSYSDCAILYRTNAQSAAIEKKLADYGIKYKIYGGLAFYRRMEVKDCIAYLKLATNTHDDFSCTRLIENTGKGIGKTTLEKIKANAKDEDKPMFIHLKENYNDLPILYKTKQGTSLQFFVKQIQELKDQFTFEPLKAYQSLNDHLHKYGYIDMLLEYEMDEKIENVHQFIDQMKNYLKEEGASLEAFVQNVTLMSSQDEIDDAIEFVKLMTIHTAKGLEFDNVFIYGLVDGIFPSMRTIQESIDGIEEERRLFYVAITRAKKRLFLSTSGGFSYNGPRYPSRFLREIEINAANAQVIIKNDNLKQFPQTDIKSGSLIMHDAFGKGVVINSTGDKITVVFNDSKFGVKTLIASHKAIHLIK